MASSDSSARMMSFGRSSISLSFGMRASDLGEPVAERQLDPGRLQAQRSSARNPRLDRVVRAAMMDHELLRRIDDQVVLHARHLEVAGELAARVMVERSRREHLDDDDGVRNLYGISGEALAAIDECIRLVGDTRTDPNRHAVRKHPAWNSGAADRGT